MADSRVDFSRDVRPILNQNCTSCHGGVRRMGGVSLIYRQEVLGKGKSGRSVVVPWRPGSSELIARVTSSDPELRMPYRGAPLSPGEIATLKQWIKEGAEWKDHWSFVPPQPQPPPAVRHKQLVRRPLDRFVLARLEHEGLQPSPEADKPALLRRVSLDLIGLPPTPEELAAYLADSSPAAFEKQVDRLLASPRYGERWASLWLDLARYADSRGYEKDLDRPAWPYRDWVIEAVNSNMPYDQFIIKQLAGDLLPAATLQDRIATAFQRLTPVNDEGGTDDEEFRLVAVMDRVATTWSVLNGITMNCVQCHSHPYDPIRHEEYYKFLSFYNTSGDADRGDDWPTLHVAKLSSERDLTGNLQDRRERLMHTIVAQARALSRTVAWSPLPIVQGSIDEVAGMKRRLDEVDRIKQQAQRPEQREAAAEYHKLLATQIETKRGASPRPLRIEAGEASAEGTVPGTSVYELVADAPAAPVLALRIEVPPIDSVTARHSPEDGFIVDSVEISVLGADGTERPLKVRYFLPDSTEVLAETLTTSTTDFSSAMSVGRFSANPKLFHLRWLIALPEEPVTLAADSRLMLRLSHSRAISLKPAVVKRIRLQTSADNHWLALARDSMLAARIAELVATQNQLAQIDAVPVPVMSEQPVELDRETLMFDRGNFLTKTGSALPPEMPELFNKLPENAPRNRLTMARWFFSPEQPLTARVAVNRFWEQLFGTGIVETLEDFGSAGLPPSHPELLDWLALHFQNDLRWDIKALLREIVTSATYRQSARATRDLMQKDPRNRLLARGPQQRLTAEMVRDQALLASGLLSSKMFGAPVMPPQPDGVWMRSSGRDWTTSPGEDSHRRAIYTYLRRSAPYPSLVTFDASDRTVSLARRIATNTPLQALVTLNDPVYHEAANALAQRMLDVKKSDGAAEGRDLLAERLNHGARRVLSRDLLPKELETLEAFLADVRGTRATSKNGAPLVATDRAAFAAVAEVFLNLDAALTR